MSFSPIQPLADIPIAVVDVETTGASAALGDAVIEVGVARVVNGQVVVRYQQLINPRRRISPAITALTGITQAMCEDQPTFAEQLPCLLEAIGGAAILGHNVRFDLSFLDREFCRCGQLLDQSLGPVPVLDTVRIARRRFGRGGNGLQRLACVLGVEAPVAHRALADCLTTLGVFERLLAPVGGWGLCLCDCLIEQGGPMSLLSAVPRQDVLPLELEEALEQRRPVLMTYLDAEGQQTQRTIQPLHIRRSAGELVLVAHCQLRDARRTFKLGRIVHLTRIEG